jgi:hypothetical protein
MPSAHEILERLQEEMNAVMTDSGDRAAQPANTRKAYSRPQALWKECDGKSKKRKRATEPTEGAEETEAMARSLEISPPEELGSVSLERAVSELSSILHSGFQAQEKWAQTQEKRIQLQEQQVQHQFDRLHSSLAALGRRLDELDGRLDLIRSEQRAFLEGKVPIALTVGPGALRLTSMQQQEGPTSPPVPPCDRGLNAAPICPPAQVGDDVPRDDQGDAQTAPVAHPPVFRPAPLSTVGQVWQEWKEGFGGNPAVEKLEKDWGARWRSDARMRKWFSRRKVIWDRLREIIAAGYTTGDAVRQLEELRNEKSLNQLVNLLQQQKAQRQA